MCSAKLQQSFGKESENVVIGREMELSEIAGKDKCT